MTNIIRVGDQLINLGQDDVGDGTVRICIADNDTNLSAIVALLESIDTSLTTISSALSSLSTVVTNCYDILNDVYIAASHRIRTLAQAL